MFFKRSQPSDPSPRVNGEVTTVAARAQPLEASELRRVVDPATLGFKTTEELHPITGLIGQERALKAIQFGANIKSHDFNMFVLGPPASGKSTAVKAHLGPKAAEGPAPSDWAYVYNFDNPNQPKALQLPPGRARVLAKGMVASIDELRNVLPALFDGEDYQVRRRAIDEQFRSGHEEALEALNKKAQGQNIAILRTPTGFTMAPMHEGKVVKPEVFNALPEGMRREIESKVEALQRELERHPGAPAQDRQAAPRAPEGPQRGGGQGRHHRGDGRPGCRLHGRAGGRRLSGVRRRRPRSQCRLVPDDGRGRQRHRQAAGRYGARRSLPALHGQRDGLAWRRHVEHRSAGHRGAEPDLRQSGRTHRAHCPDGHDGHRLPADQAGRAASRQRRLSAAGCAQAAAFAVRLGGAEARHQGARDPHRAAGRGGGPRVHAEPRPRGHSAGRQGDPVRRSGTLLSAGRARPGLHRLLQGAGRFRRHHRALERERQRLRAPDRVDRQGARTEAGRCSRRGAHHRRRRAPGGRPREALHRDRAYRRHRA